MTLRRPTWLLFARVNAILLGVVLSGCGGGSPSGADGGTGTISCPGPAGIAVKSIATGGAYTCAVLITGGVRCWGRNNTGELGDGTWTDRAMPPTTDVLDDVQAIATAFGTEFAHTCALTTNGGVRCWGNNEHGQLGDGTQISRSTPPATDVLTGVQAIGVGVEHTCALMTTGGVRCWGWNFDGQLGDGTTTDRSTPPTTDVLSDVQAIAVGGEHTCALMTTGGVRCWGWNSAGQLVPPVRNFAMDR